MTQYIDKAAIVAELEKRIKEHHSGYLVCLKDILSFLDTLEVKEEALDKTKLMQKCVHEAYKRGYDMGALQTTNKMNHNTKEVDLEKEIQEVQRNHKTIEEYKGYPCTMYADDIEWIAKHFFELGLKAQKRE